MSLWFEYGSLVKIWVIRNSLLWLWSLRGRVIKSVSLRFFFFLRIGDWWGYCYNCC